MMRRAVVIGFLALASLAQPLPAQVPWPAEGPPRPLPARDVAFPPYELRTLENGLQVVVVRHHEQPVVSMRMIVRAGAALDPPGKAGLATLAASLLDQGTATQSAGEMNSAIDFIGGAMGAGAGTDLTFVNVLVMKDSFEVGMRMLSDMARRPAFADEEIERQRQQAISALQVNFEDPEFVADAVFNRLVYGFHPYGQLESGTRDTLTSIVRADLVSYHQRHFVPNNALIAIVGDVTTEEALDSARRVFGDWARGAVERQALAAPPSPTRRVVVINKPDAVQTEIRAGHIGISRNSSDYMGLNMALRILGGEGANRLHQVLRTERGLTYGAKADLHTLLESGDFEASTNTRSEATGEVLRLMVDEFWRLQRERVSERELAGAKDYLAGSFPLTIETPDAIATQVLNVLFYGLSVDDLQSFRQRVNAVRPDDIERVARQYLRPDRLSIVLVGNAAAFRSQLGGLGFGGFELVEMADLDLMAADFKKAAGRGRSGPAGPAPGGGSGVRPGGAASIQHTPSFRSGETVRRAAYQGPGTQSVAAPQNAKDLLAKVIAAKGGLERLSAVRTVIVTAKAAGFGPYAGQPPLESITYLAYPDRVRVETRGDGVISVQAYDGHQAWVRDTRGTREMPDRVVSSVEAGLRRDAIATLLAANAGRIQVRVLPDVRDESTRLRHVLEFSGPDFDPMVFHIDSETSRIVKQSYVPGGVGGPLVEELFDDYRVVSGVSIAFVASVRVGGEIVLERTIVEIALDLPVSPELFERPAS